MTEEMEKIPKEENYLVEFKDFSGGLSFKELAKTFCAFANTDGGDLYIGVTDQRQIRGISLKPSLLDGIQNAAREGCSPPVPFHLHKIAVGSDKYVLQISIPKSGHLHSTAAGQTY